MDSDPSGNLSLRAAGLIIDGILLLASIASAAMGLKASLKLIGIFSKNVIKQTKKKIVSIVKPILGTVLKAVLGFAVPTVAALTDYAVDLFLNMSLGYAIALAIYSFIPISRRVLTK